MSPNVLVLLLRIAAAIVLYCFLLGAVVVMWRDWHVVARQAEQMHRASSRALGRLVVVDSGQTEHSPGQSFPLSVVTGLGRASSNTVIVEDSFASSEHALVSLRNGRWWLEDLGSRNGTRLNGETLTAPAIVATGDEVGIGSLRLRIELE